jgi:hypothetical protein
MRSDVPAGELTLKLYVLHPTCERAASEDCPDGRYFFLAGVRLR